MLQSFERILFYSFIIPHFTFSEQGKVRKQTNKQTKKHSVILILLKHNNLKKEISCLHLTQFLNKNFIVTTHLRWKNTIKTPYTCAYYRSELLFKSWDAFTEIRGWCTNKVLNINYYFYKLILISLWSKPIVLTQAKHLDCFGSFT